MSPKPGDGYLPLPITHRNVAPGVWMPKMSDRIARIARDFSEIPFPDHEARLLAEAYLAQQEALEADPEKWSFWTLVRIAELLLARAYPEDVFDGSSGDPGPVFVVKLREALAVLSRRPT